jgi:hypothetical protein
MGGCRAGGFVQRAIYAAIVHAARVRARVGGGGKVPFFFPPKQSADKGGVTKSIQRMVSGGLYFTLQGLLVDGLGLPTDMKGGKNVSVFGWRPVHQSTLKYLAQQHLLSG